MMVTSRMFIYLVVFVVSSITSVEISAVVFDVVRREEPLRNVQVELEIQSIFAVLQSQNKKENQSIHQTNQSNLSIVVGANERTCTHARTHTRACERT